MNYFAQNILYGVVCFFPFVFFAYYPLRYFKRFSIKIMCALELAISIPEMILFLFALKYSSKRLIVVPVVIIVFNVLPYMLLYKINLGRILFNLLLIVNTANFTVIFARYLATVIFPNTAEILFYWTDSLCILLTELFFILPIFFFVKHVSDSMVRNNTYNYIWRLAWIVPFILSLLGVALIYTPNIIAFSKMELYAKQSMICAMIVVCLLLTYSFIAKLINTQYGILKLEKEMYIRSLQKLQYHKIEQQIKDIRIIRHDLRHHIAIMWNYTEQKEYDKLKDYLSQYCQSIDRLSQLRYTNNSIVNTLLVYYSCMCSSSQISFEAKVTLPDTMTIQDSEISVIFGNLLENAYQACLEMDESLLRHISISACIRSNIILIVIENTFSNNLKQDGIGNFLTTKSDGSGIGLLSIKEIVSKYYGYITFQTSNGIFSVSLSFPNQAT